MPNFLRPPEQRGYPEGLSEVTTKQGGLWCGLFGEPVAEPIAICGTRQHGLRNSKSDETINRAASERWQARGGKVRIARAGITRDSGEMAGEARGQARTCRWQSQPLPRIRGARPIRQPPPPLCRAPAGGYRVRGRTGEARPTTCPASPAPDSDAGRTSARRR